MHFMAFIAGFICCLGVLLDAFQTIILPRRPAGRLRITRLFFIVTWIPWRACSSILPSRKARDQFYSAYGPLSLLLLIGVWAWLLVGAFALMFYGLGAPFHDALNPISRT